MPTFGARNVETAIAGLSEAPAPIDLFPGEKEARIHQPNAPDGRSADEKGAAADIASGFDVFTMSFFYFTGSFIIIGFMCLFAFLYFTSTI